MLFFKEGAKPLGYHSVVTQTWPKPFHFLSCFFFSSSVLSVLNKKNSYEHNEDLTVFKLKHWRLNSVFAL